MIRNFLQNKNNFSQRGFTLIESLVAVSIFTVSVLALVVILSGSLQDLNYAKKKIIATYLAQEGLEFIRNKRDTLVLDEGSGGWTDFQTQATNCFNSNGCYVSVLEIQDGQNQSINISILPCSTNSCPELFYNELTGKYNYNPSGTSSGFSRKIFLENTVLNKEIKMTSTITWNQGSGQKEIAVSDVLFNWWEQ